MELFVPKSPYERFMVQSATYHMDMGLSNGIRAVDDREEMLESIREMKKILEESIKKMSLLTERNKERKEKMAEIIASWKKNRYSNMGKKEEDDQDSSYTQQPSSAPPPPPPPSPPPPQQQFPPSLGFTNMSEFDSEVLEVETQSSCYRPPSPLPPSPHPPVQSPPPPPTSPPPPQPPSPPSLGFENMRPGNNPSSQVVEADNQHKPPSPLSPCPHPYLPPPLLSPPSPELESKKTPQPPPSSPPVVEAKDGGKMKSISNREASFWNCHGKKVELSLATTVTEEKPNLRERMTPFNDGSQEVNLGQLSIGLKKTAWAKIRTLGSHQTDQANWIICNNTNTSPVFKITAKGEEILSPHLIKWKAETKAGSQSALISPTLTITNSPTLSRFNSNSETKVCEILLIQTQKLRLQRALEPVEFRIIGINPDDVVTSADPIYIEALKRNLKMV